MAFAVCHADAMTTDRAVPPTATTLTTGLMLVLSGLLATVVAVVARVEHAILLTSGMAPTDEHGDPTTGAIPFVTAIAVVLLLVGLPVLGVAVHRIARRSDLTASPQRLVRPSPDLAAERPEL